MFIVHHLEASRSHRLIWALELTGLPYTLQRYARDPSSLAAPPELQQVHPLGFAPVLEDRTDPDHPVVVAESGAILEYLAQHHAPQLRPTQGEAGRQTTYWLHYAEGTLMPPLLVSLILGQISGPKVPFLVRPVAKAIAKAARDAYVRPRLARHLDFLDAHLRDRTWFVTDTPTVADIQLSYPLLALSQRADLSQHPHLRAWIDRLQAEPTWQRTMEVGGSLSLG